MKIDAGIFKAYDIRGIYEENLDENLAYKIGRAYATLLQNESDKDQLEVVVSRDMRESSESLSEALIKGLNDQGVNVVNIGMSSTPTFYFAVAYYDYDGGVQVSASHNPAEYNGFKMTRAKAVPVSGETGIEDIRDMVLADSWNEPDSKGTIGMRDGIMDELVKVQTEEWMIDLDKIKGFKIVVDAANAMGAVDMQNLFAEMDVELVPVNFELDGSFPNHEADPLKEENMEQLREAVLEHKADLGIATDGDGDRIFLMDEKGVTVRPDVLRGLIAQMVLRDFPGATIGYDIRPGKITVDLIEQAGGIPLITKVGHSLIKESMIKHDSAYGGESSGHFYFRFSFGTFDSPIVLVLKFLEIMMEERKPVSEIIAPHLIYPQSGEINSVVDDPKAVFEALAEKYSDADISYLDGITITYDTFWFNVRASNTEPKVRLNLEAVDQATMAEKRDEVLSIIRG